MDQSEKRVIASLLLLLGLTLLAIGLNTGQIEMIMRLLKETFGPAIAGS